MTRSALTWAIKEMRKEDIEYDIHPEGMIILKLLYKIMKIMCHSFKNNLFKSLYSMYMLAFECWQESNFSFQLESLSAK